MRARAGRAGLALAACLFGCGRSSTDDSRAAATADSADSADSSDSSHSVVDLVDRALPLAVAGQRGWGYERTASADLDGDGTAERVALIANAAVRKGRPLWDDAQIWQLYIEEPGGTRSYAFARWVQLGRVDAVLEAPERGEPARVLLVERTPQSYAVYEVRYRGPADLRVVELVRRTTDPSASWTGTVEP